MNRSELAYYWIDDKATQASRWLNKNIGRMLFAIGAAGVSAYGHQQPEGTFLRNISPELFGIVLTGVIINYTNERQQEKERKLILIAQLGSKRRDVTELAVIELRNRSWLYDGSLKGSNLSEANWSKANLEKINLAGSYLSGANLSEAALWRANLSGAVLTQANLSGADMNFANLSGAYLTKADLSGAVLAKANLTGADLVKATLSKVVGWSMEQLSQAAGLEGATMPDGTQLGIDSKIFSADGSIRGLYTPIEGPSFEEWKDQYLATHSGSVTDLRVGDGRVEDPTLKGTSN